VKKTIVVLGALAAIVGIGCLCTFAQTPRIPSVGRGQIYNRQDIWRHVNQAPAQLPKVSESTEGAGIGPIARPEAGAGTSRDVSLPSQLRHGTFLTPLERTDREIKKTIRNLG
jgi:hypothetical protein